MATSACAASSRTRASPSSPISFGATRRLPSFPAARTAARTTSGSSSARRASSWSSKSFAHDREEGRRLEPRALSGFPALGDHPVHHDPRLGETLAVARAREERDDPRCDRHVLVVLELLDARQGIGRRMVIQEEQSRRPHVPVRIAQQLLDPRQDPEIAGGVEKLEGPPAHVGRLVMRAGRARRVRRRVLRRAEDLERVEHLLRIGRGELSREDVGRGLVENRGQLPLGVEPPLPQALEQRVRRTAGAP